MRDDGPDPARRIRAAGAIRSPYAGPPRDTWIVPCLSQWPASTAHANLVDLARSTHGGISGPVSADIHPTRAINLRITEILLDKQYRTKL